MRRFLWIPICFFALAVPVIVLAGGAQGGFDGVVSSIETRYHAHAARIPFLGLISLIARKSTHEGVGSIHVARSTASPPTSMAPNSIRSSKTSSAPAGSASFAKPAIVRVANRP